MGPSEPQPDSSHAAEIDARMRRDLTYRLELRRSVTSGILETSFNTFAVLVAVKVFAAGPNAKAMIFSAQSAGHLLSPLLVAGVAALAWPPAHGAALLALVSGLGYLAAVILPGAWGFIGGVMLALFCLTAATPLMTQILQDNYPDHERGRLFSRTVILRVISAAAFGWAAGWFLSSNLGRFVWLFVIFALCAWLGGVWLTRCPSQPLRDEGRLHPWRCFGSLRGDPAFRWVLFTWMLTGFACLTMFPLRVDYLAGLERDGLGGYRPDEIALLVAVLPNLSRLVTSQIWGHLFDRINFFVMRILINLFFVAAMLVFFQSENLLPLVIGALILGVAFGGGDIAWSLWVTKLAPPDRVADYMAMHTFLTGVRGIIAPIVGFNLVTRMPAGKLAWAMAGLICLSCLLLIPELKSWHRRRPGFPLTPQAPHE